MTIRVILAQIYRFTFQAIFNIVFNLYHLTRIIVTGKLSHARYMLAMHRSDILLGQLPKMRYKIDGIIDSKSTLGKWPYWTAVPIVFAGMGMQGNCMDAAYFFRRVLSGTRVRVWIPDGPKWYARVHYVCETKSGTVCSLTKAGLKVHKSLSACRAGGRWI